MLVQTEKREITTNIENEAIDFKIDNDSHVIFEGLRKSLYPDPIKAIAREITANALDAHIENGNADTPIEIFFPEGYLVIKDHGVGISPDRMEQVFCWYGRSTKRDGNEQIGGWGIGAKSVWSYADSFVVDTVYDGIKYTYTAFIDESLKGKMLLMHSDASDEANGTSIKIPIRREDRFLFKMALRNHTKFWKVPPTFHGEINEPPFLPTLNADKWAIYLKETGGYNVLSGGIPYQDYTHNIPPKVVLKFEVGELDLTLNRDTLRYTEKTNNAIKNRLIDFSNEVVKQVQGQLDAVETFGEVITLIQGIPHQKSNPHKWTWKGDTFNYPFTKAIVCYERPRQKLNCFRTYVVQDDVKDEAFIELDKDEVTSYDRQRIGSYLNNNLVSRVYLIEPNTLPVKAKKLSSIKVVRTKNPGGVKAAKTTIKGKEWRNRRCSHYLIDGTNTIVYTTNPIESLKSVYSLNISLVEISEKDVKYIDGKKNWISLDDYIKQNLFDKLKPNEIQEIANRNVAVGNYQNFSFLADHHPDFAFLKKEKLDNKVSSVTMGLVDFLVENGKITAVLPDLYEKYEMFKVCGYIGYDKHNVIKNYVDLVNKVQENENVK